MLSTPALAFLRTPSLPITLYTKKNEKPCGGESCRVFFFLSFLLVCFFVFLKKIRKIADVD